MINFSNHIINQKKSNQLLNQAYIHLKFKQEFDSLLSNILDTNSLDSQNIKYFIKEKEHTFNVKISTKNHIHGIVLKTKIIEIQAKIEEILDNLKIKKQPEIKIC
jgi:hypothetical protein